MDVIVIEEHLRVAYIRIRLRLPGGGITSFSRDVPDTEHESHPSDRSIRHHGHPELCSQSSLYSKQETQGVSRYSLGGDGCVHLHWLRDLGSLGRRREPTVYDAVGSRPRRMRARQRMNQAKNIDSR